MHETKYLSGLNWQLLTSEKNFLRTTLYYKRKERDIDFGHAFTHAVNGVVPTKEQAPKRPDLYTEDVAETEFGVRSHFTHIVSNSISLFAGIEAQRVGMDFKILLHGSDTAYTFDRNDYRPDPAQKYVTRRPEFVNSTVNETKLQLAGILEASLALSDALTLNPGIRFERDEIAPKSYFSPRFSASYALDPSTSLNFAAGTYYQSPDLRVIGAHPGNRALSNEKSVHAILGLTRYIGDGLKLTLEGYYKTFDDLIAQADRSTTLRRNAGDGWAAGVDMGVVRRFVDDWYGQVNYSYAQSKRNDHDGLGAYNSDFNQPHVFNILVGYQLNDEWAFSSKWKYATGRPADDFIVHRDVFSNPNFLRFSKEIVGNNTRRLDDFHTFNVRVDFRKQLGRFAIVSFLDVLNVYNRLNVNEERFLEQTGGIYKKGFEMIPTFGLKLEL